jgi:tetratricopeptide (TPR) repeat protein
MRVVRLSSVAVLVLATFLIGCSHNLVNQAQQYELAGNNASALLAFQDALAATPERNHRERSELLMRIGECLYRMDRLPESFNAFQKASEADQTNTMAHLRLGEMLLSAGAADRAREQALWVLKSMATNNEALSLLGAAWAASDNPSMAKAVYEQVLRTDPKRVKIAVSLADIYNRENDVKKAREILKQAAVAQPQSALPWLATARLEEQEGNGAEAEEAYRRAVAAEDTPETNFRLAQFLQRAARITEAEQVLRRVDSQRKTYPVALPDFQLLSGHPGNAMNEYRSALQATSPAPARKGFWQRLKNNALSSSDSKNQATVAARMIEAEISAANHQRGKERTASLEAIRKRLDSFRSVLDQATACVLQAEIALADNNTVMAQVYAKSALELAPDSASAHYVNGLAESSLGNPENAAKEWDAALDSDSHYTPAHLAIAEAALTNGNGVDADEHARIVVRDDPGNFHALVVFSRALLTEGKPSLAAIMAQRAAALDPSSPEPSILLGEISLQLNQIANAMLAFERAVASHPDSEDAIDGLLRVYRRGTVSYSALEKMETVAQTPPVSSTLLEIAGRLYADRGWYSEAIRALSKAVQIDPSRTTAVRVLARLQLATGDFAQASKVASKASSSQQPLLRGYQAESSGDWHQAIDNYERAVREGDQTGVAANNLAWLYAEHNELLDRALSLAESAVKYAPNDPAVLDTLGYVYLQRREYTSAVNVLETAAHLSALNKSPGTREAANNIRKHLSDAYFRSGQTTAAAQIAQNHGSITLK